MSGGFLATCAVTAASYVAGALLGVADLAARITPGQASLIVGMLGLLFQLIKWLVERRDRGRTKD